VSVGGALARATSDQVRADVRRATELVDDGHLAEAIEILSDLIRPWGHAPPDDIADWVAHATVLAALTAVRAGPNLDAALRSCDDVVEHYGSSPDPGVRATVVWALRTQGYIHACAERYDDAASSCASAIEYAGDDQDPRVRSSVEQARAEFERWHTEHAGG
jgi:hypothetical protein